VHRWLTRCGLTPSDFREAGSSPDASDPRRGE
jgi:hypothetical protein